MDTVKVIIRKETNLFTFRNECIYVWNTVSNDMEILLTNQDFKSWLQFLKNYKGLGAEVINVFDRSIIEYSTLDALIRNERLKENSVDNV